MSQKSQLEKKLQEGTVICAEGYLFELERRGHLQAGPFVPEVVLDNPEVVEQVHREFVNAGSDVVLAFTYYAHEEKLKSIGRTESVEDLNKKALQIAKQVADETGTILAGNISNTWVYDPQDEQSWEEVKRQHREQVQWAKDAGADFIVAEMFEYLGEAELALEVVQEFGLPAVVNLGVSQENTRDGVEPTEALQKLSDQGALVVGLNCLRGPETMIPIIQKLREEKGYEGYVAAVPVPYHTHGACPSFRHLKRKDDKSAFTVDLDEHLLGRYQIEDFAKQAQDLNVNFVGLCCGNSPHYTRALAEAYGRNTPSSKYSPKLSEHPIFGTQAKLQDKEGEETSGFGREF
jgi:betaine-homocysteine S-methyltransferase